MTAPSEIDPRWIDKIYSNSRGEDFLGLRAVQANIVGYVLPGITTITPRARYYAFYSWLLAEYGHTHPAGMSLAHFIKRREQIFGLAHVAWNATLAEDPPESGLIGTNTFRRHWYANSDEDQIPLGVDDYLGADYGGYSQYASVMRTLMLTQQPEADTLEILPKGQELAQAFATAIEDTEYYRLRHSLDEASSIHREVLEEYGTRCHLSRLAGSPDCLPTLEALFAFDSGPVAPTPREGDGPVQNMKGSLGLIMDMLAQADSALTEDDFRRAIAFGLCSDFSAYKPSESTRPILAHWRMFQLREYNVYALYALWAYFLYWLRLEGLQTLDEFCLHLRNDVNLASSAAAAGLDIPDTLADECSLTHWLSTLLDACGVLGSDFGARCKAFSMMSDIPINEDALYRLLDEEIERSSPLYAGVSWLLLSILFLRLRGLEASDLGSAWYWAKSGQARRLSLARFVRDMSAHLSAGSSLLEVWRSLFRDYVIAQHIITSLEKWNNRKANTFHFTYENGVFEWVRDGTTGFSATRFRQAHNMLADLGLIEFAVEEGGRALLTQLGHQILERVLEACNG